MFLKDVCMRKWNVPVCLMTLFLAACANNPANRPVSSGAADPVQQPVSTVQPAVQREDRAVAAVDEKNSVFFASSSAALDALAEQALREHAARIKVEPNQVVRLVGHTDDLGSRAYNLAIAEQRVNAVYGFLRRAGVPARQLRRSGSAGDLADKSCESAECRAKKRRVELVYPAP